MWEPKIRHGLIDGDIVAYSCAWVCNSAPDKTAAFAAVRDMLLNFRETLELDDADIYLTGPSNFRKNISLTYKAQRADKPKPKYLSQTIDYLQDYWDATWVDGLEADDVLGIQCNKDPDKIIISTDKDLDQIVGYHYNWKKYSIYYIDQEQATRWLWSQMLIGDTADNIKGVKGLGIKKTTKLLENIPVDKLPETVYDIYIKTGMTARDFEVNQQLLTILKEEQE
jgi:5'-3' exonuclease